MNEDIDCFSSSIKDWGDLLVDKYIKMCNENIKSSVKFQCELQNVRSD